MHCSCPPSLWKVAVQWLMLDNIQVMVIVWRLRGNIIRTALSCIVWHNVQHTYVSSSYRLNRLGLSHWDPYAVRRGGCLELYYCNMMEWFWRDSSLIFDDQLVSFSALTLLVKIVPKMTYNVLRGTLSLYTTTTTTRAKWQRHSSPVSDVINPVIPVYRVIFIVLLALLHNLYCGDLQITDCVVLYCITCTAYLDFFFHLTCLHNYYVQIFEALVTCLRYWSFVLFTIFSISISVAIWSVIPVIFPGEWVSV